MVEDRTYTASADGSGETLNSNLGCQPKPPGKIADVVSVILPVHNGSRWIDACLSSLEQQSYTGPIELSAFDDGSTDSSWSDLQRWAGLLEARGMRVICGRSESSPGGCGFAKNRAVSQSSGAWLCFMDVDDVMAPERIERQLAAARAHPRALVGARVRREPAGSTARYISWVNGMSQEQLVLQRFRECTLVMPTWFIARSDFDAVGGFREEQCEDLLFLLEHVARGGRLHRVEGDPLLTYTYHAHAASHSISRATLLRHRAAALERAVLGGWQTFSIWGAGRDGRALFKALSPEARRKVSCFCDVDECKVGTKYQYYEYSVPVIHWRNVNRPLITCVALDRTDGAFEANLASLGLREGADFFYFC
uniref:Glycosyltransferase 2-like domain-containing protein n=1 Tax=Chrysotila carterae TaxID=13221 RepID=A0A7S4EW01_CHRCT|mmetsp:Transcript_17471/g.34113  ORF Transcript_17471/g.34113 Transcript_17471/m.34113 type:complete len:366 (+) Transcript_17471:101-1198(+)